jgi:gliding motility-associated lipoprotein GldH
LKHILFCIGCFLLLFTACQPKLEVFEKDVTIPGQQWESSFKPQVVFQVTDTASLYNIYFVFRHTDAYNYNNIWVKATVWEPGNTQSKSGQNNLVLATNNKGWLGSARDDIYEQRVLVQPQTKFNKPGEYRFTIEQIMREDPLKNMLNVGVRVEKAK